MYKREKSREFSSKTIVMTAIFAPGVISIFLNFIHTFIHFKIVYIYIYIYIYIALFLIKLNINFGVSSPPLPTSSFLHYIV